MTLSVFLRLAALSILLAAPRSIPSSPRNFAAAGAPAAQVPDQDQRLPSGKLQREEILKADHEKNLEDAARIQKLAREVEQDLKEQGYTVLSRDSLRKTEEIEKLAKRIKQRLRR